MSSLAPLTVALPLVAAALLVVAGKRVGRRASDAFAIATCLAVAAMALVLLRASAASPIRHDLGGFAPRGELVLGIALEVEPIGAGLVALGAALAALALLFATKYFERVEALFHALLLAFVAGLAGFALTFDLFDLFVFFELMSVSAFALAGYESDEPAALQGAINFAVPHAVAGAVMLMGIGVLYQRAGTLDLGALGRALATRPDRVVAVAFVLVNAALLVKSALVPFHFWLPDAHAVAPTPVSVMFSSVMVPAGLYGIARVSETAFAGAFAASPDRLRALLVVPGAITVVATGVLALAQRHIKRLLAFSTASHMGLIAVGIALAWPEPPRAAATYALGHGLVKASLFLATGIVLHRYRSVDTVELRGRGREMPWLGVLFAAGALALAGLPPFGVATGTEALEDLARGRGARWFPWLAAASAVL
ncbi:MAG TPA: proton-conducting transporter membrane subunit, partial [Minicystis sp.]|nr:proton-conducting transporter membrane subunit [Minicystis sp.]